MSDINSPPTTPWRKAPTADVWEAAYRVAEVVDGYNKAGGTATFRLKCDKIDFLSIDVYNAHGIPGTLMQELTETAYKHEGYVRFLPTGEAHIEFKA